MPVCLRLTRNNEDAVEALNTAFFRIFQSLHQYDPARASLYTWMRTIVVNTCLNFLRSRQKHPPLLNIEAAAVEDVFTGAEDSWKAEHILQLLRTLPPTTQAVFTLFVIEGYGHKEIAQMLTISEGTSKWQLSEARKYLRKHLITRA